MTSPFGPIWMASPPEVHSALLSTGPGPGSLLAAAGAWSSLSAEYASAAAELSGLLGAVQAGAWQGPSAEQYVAAAYAGALAAMPTLVELAANRVIHGVLLATNFFGIKTIPIALNEADYVRMWVQAATTIGAYQAASGGALASAPRTTPAPSIVNPGSGDLSNAAAQSSPGSWLVQLLQTYVNLYEVGSQQFSALLQNPVGTLQQIITAFATNPAAALVAYAPLLFFGAYEVISPIATYGPMLMALSLGVSLSLGQITLPLGELAPIAAPIAAGAAGVPALASTASTVWPVAGVAPTVATPAGAPASVGAAGAAPAAAPAPVATTGTFAYMVGFGGGPGTEAGPTLGGRGGAKAPAATIPAAGAVAPSRAEARARRRRRAAMREYGDEFLDMDSDIGVAPDYGGADEADEFVSAVASGSGAGSLGFAGTAQKDAAAGAAGLTKLAGDEFGGGPRVPMVPGTWDRDGPGESGRGGDDGS